MEGWDMGAILGWSGQVKRGQWPVVHHVLHELFAGSAAGTDPTAGFAALRPEESLTWDGRQGWGNRYVAVSPQWSRLRQSPCVVAHCGAAAHDSADVDGVQGIPPAVSPRRTLAVVVAGEVSGFSRVVREQVGGPPCRCESDAVLRLVESARDPAEGLRLALDRFETGWSAAALDVARRTVWVCCTAERPLWLLELDGIKGRFFAPSEVVAQRAVRIVVRWREGIRVRSLLPMAPGRVVSLSPACSAMTH